MSDTQRRFTILALNAKCFPTPWRNCRGVEKWEEVPGDKTGSVDGERWITDRATLMQTWVCIWKRLEAPWVQRNPPLSEVQLPGPSDPQNTSAPQLLATSTTERRLLPTTGEEVTCALEMMADFPGEGARCWMRTHRGRREI